MRCAEHSPHMNRARSSSLVLHENALVLEKNAHPSGAQAYKSKARSHSLVWESESFERLVEAFDALTELEHARCALDASNVVLSVLDDLIPCRASAIALYDINAHALRFVATKGLGAETRRKIEVSLREQSCVTRAASMAQPLVFEGTSGDFNATTDAPEGVLPNQMLLASVAHEGRLRGLIQLIDRRATSFAEADHAVLTYIADRFALFFER